MTYLFVFNILILISKRDGKQENREFGGGKMPSFLYYLKKLFIWPHCLNCSMWDLVLWPGIEPGSSALGVCSLSHWTTREVLVLLFLPRFVSLGVSLSPFWDLISSTIKWVWIWLSLSLTIYACAYIYPSCNNRCPQIFVYPCIVSIMEFPYHVYGPYLKWYVYTYKVLI